MFRDAPLRLFVPGLLIVCQVLVAAGEATAQSRALGLDVSAWQGNISTSSWNTLHNVNDRDFVFIRSTRGGTTGYYNQNDPNNNLGGNTLSQRYDDPYFAQNITRATNAGMLAGSYHFARPDIVANTGADEADHMLQMAGAWMRPGYLLPVLDLEAGVSDRSNNDMAQFAVDFSNRIHEVTGLRPMIYTSGNYANYLQGASSALQDEVVETLPYLWSARWPNQSNPDAIPIQTGHPKDSYSPIYGPWDDSPNPTHPWSFWQYASTGRLSGYNNGNSNLDLNVAQGGVEFLKDHLAPALWTGGDSGEWTDLANWNSGQTPTAPVSVRGQAARVGTLTLPEVRLPGADDTVLLDVADAAVTVTLSSGAHSVRRLIAREPLNLADGSLTIGVVPSNDSPAASLVVGAPVAVAGGELSAHTIEVESQQQLSVVGDLTFASLQLASSTSAPPASLAIEGDIVLSPLADGEAVIESFGGLSHPGVIDPGGSAYHWQVTDGAAETDVRIRAAIATGSFIKTGDGTLSLEGTTGYSGDLDVRSGGLRLDGLLLGNQAEVSLATGSLLTLNQPASADAIGRLTIDGVPMGVGEYGAIGSGALFESALLAGPGRLLVTEVALAGDYNADGVVDAADYAAWRQAATTGAVLPNETTTPGQVTSEDYDAWRANFGATLTSAGAASAIPSPAGSALVAALGCAASGTRRRRPR
ncbi:Lysozyme M1 precursor [Posidoniimonas polymericola]|uniref:Lysozyme M1 n=2 Tax=Posidoniimonas polymericola TaxID=2528002 RepID=A0A5C5YTZ6_9BACT|nr:Lysozyme M1 precursor [Posidoniimonas polymericola]